MIWKFKNGEFDLGVRARIMGVLNVTLDSFSDGGRYVTVEKAVAHAMQMIGEGAEIIDIGGESTRPGAEPVGAEEEMRRVLPVIAALAEKMGQMGPIGQMEKARCVISIDTSKAEVARAAVEAGAGIINDVTGLRGDPGMAEVVRSTGAGLVIMHMQGTPRTMQEHPHYENVVREVADFFRQSFTDAVTSGIHPMKIAFDPGIGFGKSGAHNLLLLKSIESLRVEGRPLVVGASRKSFIGKITGSEAMVDRFWPTVALTSLAREKGADIIRVHDVRANSEALRMTEAIIGEET
jgi:dihydropteroate synthase